MSKFILAYKIRGNDGLSSCEVIKLFEDHAKKNNGNVLFSSNKVPKAEKRDMLVSIILISKNGDYAIKGDVDYTGIIPYFNPPSDYSLPPLLQKSVASDSKKGWFALKNVKRVDIKKGDYITTTKNDLLDSLNNNTYMFYIEYK